MASTAGTATGLLPPSSLASRRKQKTEAITEKPYENFGESDDDSSVDEELLNMYIFTKCTESAKKEKDDNEQQKHEQQGQQVQRTLPSTKFSACRRKLAIPPSPIPLTEQEIEEKGKKNTDVLFLLSSVFHLVV